MAAKLAEQAGRSPAYRFSAALEDARRAGLLEGRRTERLSFRAPAALIEAARRVSGARSPTELGILALAPSSSVRGANSAGPTLLDIRLRAPIRPELYAGPT